MEYIPTLKESNELVEKLREHFAKCSICRVLARKADRKRDGEAKYHLARRALGLEPCSRHIEREAIASHERGG
jgi:hypothetical protein